MDLAEKIEDWWDHTGLTLYSFCLKFTTVKPRQIERLIERSSRPSNVRVWTAYDIISVSRSCRSCREKIDWGDFLEDQIEKL